MKLYRNSEKAKAAKARKKIRGGQNLVVTVPKEQFKMTPFWNFVRAIIDGQSKNAVMSIDGRSTTETVETYIRYAIRVDNMQWLFCLNQNSDALIELFSMPLPSGGEEGSAHAGGDAALDSLTTAEKAEALRLRRAAEIRASDARRAEEHRLELLEHVRQNEDVAREIIAMQISKTNENILQYWRWLRLFSRNSSLSSAMPRLIDETAFTGENKYRAYVAKLREDVPRPGMRGDFPEPGPICDPGNPEHHMKVVA